jgi:hypothetical protein
MEDRRIRVAGSRPIGLSDQAVLLEVFEWGCFAEDGSGGTNAPPSTKEITEVRD